MPAKRAVIVLSHGSRIAEANDDVLKLSALMQENTHQGDEIKVSTAFLQFGKPSLEESIKNLVERGYEEVLLAPLFLTPGVHITQDIPEIISGAQDLFHGVQFKLCRHLGCDHRLIPILWDRINEHMNNNGGEKDDSEV
jgi:sirohydrochlorin ferrochelatase